MNDPTEPTELADILPFPSRRRAAGLSRDEVQALSGALAGLRREIDDRFPAPAVESPADGFDWVELVGELRGRLRTLGMSERSAEVDEFGFDPSAHARTRSLFDFLVDRYWRVELFGADSLPEREPVLFVANRSGLLPWDGLVFAHTMERALPNWERPRFLVADWLVTLPFAQPALARLGGVRACRENTDRLLRGGRSVLAFPEGVKGAAKVFRDRYRLQRFGRGGAVRAAIENGVPLVPVGIVGAEESNPILFKSRIAGRALGLPFVPVTPTFPLLGPAGLVPLPTKWSIEIGEALALDAMDASAATDELLVSRMNETLRARIRELVERGLDRRESAWG